MRDMQSLAPLDNLGDWKLIGKTGHELNTKHEGFPRYVERS